MKHLYFILFTLSSFVAFGQLDSTVEGDRNAVFEPVQEDSLVGGSRETYKFPLGWFVETQSGWDTLNMGLSLEVEQALWGEATNQRNWDWTKRRSSALGGLVYSPLDFAQLPELDGRYSWLSREVNRPERTIASAPRSTLSYRSGLGGGQQFGLEVLSPAAQFDQLYLDYQRTNALGFYQNEGSDGHDLFLQYVRHDSLSGQERDFVRVRFFQQNAGGNGGLQFPELFESNVPSLRRNFSVVYAGGSFGETETEWTYGRKLGRNWQAEATLGRDAWHVNNGMNEREYYWDSTDAGAELKNRLVYYDDSVRLDRAVLKLAHEGIKMGKWALRPELSAGMEWYSSDVLGWDGFRVDSSNAVASFDGVVSPLVRLGGQLDRKGQKWGGQWLVHGDVQVHAVGYNAGSYQSLVQTSWEGAGTLEVMAEWRSSARRRMYRWEQLYGFGYDWNQIDQVFFADSWKLSVQRGRVWKYGVSADVHSLRNFRTGTGFSELTAYNGWIGVARAHLASDREGWNAAVEAYGTAKSADGGVALPRWGGFGEVNYTREIGQKFQLKAGLNTSVEAAFYTPTYLVGVPIWTLQDEVLAGSYPWTTVFMDFRIGSFVGGVRVLNAFEGLGNYTYYAYGTVPRSDRWVQISARWTLFN